MMGKLKGEILLAEDKVRALRKQLRHNEHIEGVSKKELELVFKMAIRQIKLTERFRRLYGKYEECYPDIARGICETFYADDTELAACFRVSPAKIERWRRLYPEFKNKSRAGRSCFTRRGGSDVCWQRWFRLCYADVARNICEVFKPTKRQLVRCFDIKIEADTWKELNQWIEGYCYTTVYHHLKSLRHRLFKNTINRICRVFGPNDEQLARVMDVSVETAKEFLDNRKLEQEKARQRAEALHEPLKGNRKLKQEDEMEGFERSLSESPEAEADKSADHQEGTEKRE